MEPVTPREPIDAFPVSALSARNVAWISVLIPLRALFAVALVIARGYFAMRKLGRVPASAYVAAVGGGMSFLILTLKDRRRHTKWHEIITEQSTR